MADLSCETMEVKDYGMIGSKSWKKKINWQPRGLDTEKDPSKMKGR